LSCLGDEEDGTSAEEKRGKKKVERKVGWDLSGAEKDLRGSGERQGSEKESGP